MKNITGSKSRNISSLENLQTKDASIEKILKIKRENPSISMAELARRTGLTSRKLKALLNPLGEWNPLPVRWRPHLKNYRVYAQISQISLMNDICKSHKKEQICCEVCGIQSWQKCPFENIAEIDHIDGNEENNAIENLRILCPNCHSHTTTRFKNVKTIHPSKNESSLEKKNIITNESDILVSDDMKKAYRKMNRLSRKSPSNVTPLEEILKGKFPNVKTIAVVRRMIGEGKREAKCQCCNLKKWREIPIGLFLHGHHINSNSTDHREENIEILCPNCHATRHTFPEIKNAETMKKKRPSVYKTQKTETPCKNLVGLTLETPLVQKVAEILDDPNRLKAMKYCGAKLGLNLNKFRRIVLTFFPDKWAPTREREFHSFKE